jgi:tripeptidyl-peptidase I
MYSLLSILNICLLLSTAVAAPASSSVHHVVHEKRHHLPPGWAKRSPLHEQYQLPMRFGAKQENLHLAEKYIADVSDPKSARYGKHYSHQEVAEIFASSKETINTLRKWLHDAGIDYDRHQLSKSLNWIEVNVTVVEAENLLKTKYHVYDHESGHDYVACEHYSVPKHVQRSLDFITPTIHFDKRITGPGKKFRRGVHPQNPHLTKRYSGKAIVGRSIGNGAQAVGRPLGIGAGRLGAPDDASLAKPGALVMNAMASLDQCDSMVTPDCLRALYNFPPGKTSNANNSFGIVEYTPQAFLQGDLNMFFKSFSPEQNGAAPVTNLIDGAVVQTQFQNFSFNGESALDLEYGMALVYPQKVTLYQAGDLAAGASFNNFIDAVDGAYCTFMGGDSKDPAVDGQYPDPAPGGFNGALQCGTSPMPKVISTSYGTNEADLGLAYETRQCLEYMKMGMQGVTVIYSSGDFGVAGNSGQCIDSVTGAYNNGTNGRFNPSFPGTCPYVTSVGATQINPGSSVHTPEGAAEQVIFSGGGFSNNFAMPTYQEAAMKTYFADHPPPYGADRFNNSQKVRGFPDVAANGVNYVVAVTGNFSLAFGTSASAPTFGSIVTLINEERMNAGKSPVGFMNPVLYAHPEILNDVQNGGNKGCGTTGFEAVTGWDPVTGLGTPDYPSMLKRFMSLP